MFCKKCGTEVTEGNYCPTCGARLKDEPGTPSFDSMSMKAGKNGAGSGSKARMIV
ncbi:MAG: hypothetical protein K6E24_02240 [bacterium]|nr:hypothetical protein [bacterium]